MAPRRNPARRNRQRRRAGLKSKFHGVKHSNTAASSQFARVVETWKSYTDLSGGQAYTIAPKLIDAVTVGGSQSRVNTVAAAYRFYRIVQVKHEFRPYHNMSAVSNTDTFALPNLYALVKKDGGFPNAFNTEYLLSQGAKPRLFNRSINISYVPNIILTAGNQSAVTANSGPTMGSSKRWLPTELGNATGLNNQVPYFGMCFVIEDNNGGGGSLGEIYTTIVVEYKDPIAKGVPDGVAIPQQWNALSL